MREKIGFFRSDISKTIAVHAVLLPMNFCRKLSAYVIGKEKYIGKTFSMFDYKDKHFKEVSRLFAAKLLFTLMCKRGPLQLETPLTKRCNFYFNITCLGI